MPQIGNSTPVQYIAGQTQVPQTQPMSNQVATQPVANTASTSKSGYPYGEDVFQGKFEMFKTLYSNFDSGVSKFSPFYGKMGSAQSSMDMGNTSGANTYQAGTQQTGGLPSSIPGSATNGDLPPIPQSALQVPPSLVNTNVPATNSGNLTPPASMQQQQAPVSSIPKKNPPSGPVINNIQQLLQQETQKITTPQKAVEVIASHAMLSRQERTMANDIAWGARFYASKAAEMAEKLNQSKKSMNPGQIQSQQRTIDTYKIKSISLLNDAKKRAISNYNEALKATMLYNNYFTESGPYATTLNDNDRQFVESEIDKTWATWQGGFDKNGQHADESPTVVDKAAREVAIALDKADKLSAQ